MKQNIIIRSETPDDYYNTELMTQHAFWNLHGPGCNEHTLVRMLRDDPAYIPELSRIAEIDGHIVGAIFYSKATITDGDKTHSVLTFGPLCVDPGYQDTGVGGKLLEETMKLARQAGHTAIVIFGESGYYPKHGFKTCDNFNILTADGDNGGDAFMAFELLPGSLNNVSGRFHEADVFEDCTMEIADKQNSEYPYLPKLHLPSQWGYAAADYEHDGYVLRDAVWYKPAMRNLFNVYIHELSQYNTWLDGQIDTHGNYLNEDFEEYFSAPEKKPYVIMIDEKPAGFVVFSGAMPDDEGDGCNCYIEEMFITLTHRGNGFAQNITKRFIEQGNGVCGLCVLKNNQHAVHFWEHTITDLGYPIDQADAGDGMWFYKINS